MIRDITDSTDISRTSRHKILQQNLKIKNMRLKLVLKILMPEQKKKCALIAETFLNNAEADLTLLGRIIKSDESWVFKYDPSTKRQSMQWKRSDEPQSKKACMARSQQKFMLILFFSVLGVMMMEWGLYQKNVDAAFYIRTLWKLRICIRKKRPKL